jgi:hypothetical protein
MSGKTGIFSMKLRRNSRASLRPAPLPSDLVDITSGLLVSPSLANGSLKEAAMSTVIVF